MPDGPIIDLAETHCPDCGEELSGAEPHPYCHRCDTTFQRVDVGETQPSFHDKVCRCGYRLRGLSVDVCPECGTDVEFDIAEYAADPPVPARDPVTERDLVRLFPGGRGGMIAAGCAGMILIVVSVLLMESEATDGLETLLFFFGLALLVIASLAAIVLR